MMRRGKRICRGYTEFVTVVRIKEQIVHITVMQTIMVRVHITNRNTEMKCR